MNKMHGYFIFIFCAGMGFGYIAGVVMEKAFQKSLIKPQPKDTLTWSRESGPKSDTLVINGNYPDTMIIVFRRHR